MTYILLIRLFRFGAVLLVESEHHRDPTRSKVGQQSNRARVRWHDMLAHGRDPRGGHRHRCRIIRSQEVRRRVLHLHYRVQGPEGGGDGDAMSARPQRRFGFNACVSHFIISQNEFSSVGSRGAATPRMTRNTSRFLVASDTSACPTPRRGQARSVMSRLVPGRPLGGPLSRGWSQKDQKSKKYNLLRGRAYPRH